MAQSQELDMEIGIVQDQINEIDNIIADTDAEIKVKEEEIAVYEEQITAHDNAFRQVLRSMDETSASSYLELLLSSKNFSEFMVHIETINEITRHDTAIIDEMVALKNSVEAAKAAIEAKKQNRKPFVLLQQTKKQNSVQNLPKNKNSQNNWKRYRKLQKSLRTG